MLKVYLFVFLRGIAIEAGSAVGESWVWFSGETVRTGCRKSEDVGLGLERMGV